MMAKALRIVGLVWLYAMGAVIAASLVAIAWNEGLGRLQQVMSPFNVANLLVTLLALSPGFLCLWIAGKLERN